VTVASPLQDLSSIFQICVEYLPKFYDVLVSPPGTKNFTNQNGHTSEAFGFHRLLILQCIDALVNSGFASILKELMSHVDLMKYLVKVFTTFPSNNFCHRFAEHVILSILASLSGERLIQFLQQTEILVYLVSTEKEIRQKIENGGARDLCVPFIFSLGSFIQEKGMLEEQVLGVLEKEPGWDVFLRIINEDRQRAEQTMGPYGEQSSNSYNPSVSEGDEDIESDEPNDADDYDTDQAEILLSKAEIEAVA